ncbi:hypothetical protein ACFVT6_14740 [Streptomyces sp. NPDC058049]|uniref:hypothetical protein n=1 Tax=Streptomyces sp. NPDC058049 TaxID=3346314 RepID=UPI0036EFE054
MLDEAIIKRYVHLDTDISNFQDHGEGLYQFDARVNGRPELGPVGVLLATNVNPTMVLLLAQIDASGKGLSAALTATSKVGVVGVAQLENSYFLRYGVFREYVEPLALTNGIQALALAYSIYAQEISF